MIFWILTLFVTFILFLMGIFYICRRMRKFGIKKWYVPYIVLTVLVCLLSLALNLTTTIIIFINYLVVWLIIDFIFFLVKKIRKKDFKYYVAGYVALALSTIYIIYGVYNVYDVRRTDYTLTSEKLNNSYKIALISDSHLGTTFDADGFNEYLKGIEKQKPDMLLIAGDFVDDGTSKDDMINASEYLGSVKTKYGVYFVHGNHDKGYYGNKRGYSSEDLEEELVRNGVNILNDESILVNDEIYLVGRKDFEDMGRLQMNELVRSLDKDKFILVMDHQPTDYDNEANGGSDLVVSGHTHGGQIIPLNILNPYLSQNDSVYGFKKINKTNFIVTSGISDWEIKMKTGCISEYVIININNK